MGGVIYMKEKIIAFVKKETVLVVAAISRAWDPAFADDHYGGRAE